MTKLCKSVWHFIAQRERGKKGREGEGHIKEQLDETYMKCENLIITCCTNAPITVGYQGLLLLRVVAAGRHVMWGAWHKPKTSYLACCQANSYDCIKINTK